MIILGTRWDRHMGLLVAALAATVAAVIGIHVVRNQKTANVVAVVDITGSMNTRDMGRPPGSENRIEAARRALVDLIQSIPCKSRLGLGVFTERNSFLLFDPVEVCGNYDALEGAISDLDWRMAWEGDSYIAKGLYSAISIAESVKSDLIFLTDGHEAPPLPSSGAPEFEGQKGEVLGLVVGVGGRDKSPIPKYDDEGREIGVYDATDVPHDNRIGPPPADAATREGYNARNAPFGALPAVGEEHLSSVRFAYLEDLARRTGLTYVELAEVGGLGNALMSAAHSRSIAAPTSLAWVPASLALLFTVVLYGLSLSSAPWARWFGVRPVS